MAEITIFSDIHSNLPALQAVLADMDTRGLNNRYCLGDLVGYGTWPNEVVETIRQSGIPTLMGNYDQGVGSSSDDCGCAYTTEEARALGVRSILWTNTHTSDENKTFLAGLPAHIPLEVEGRKVLLVHGSPRKINEYLFEDRREDSVLRIMDSIEVEILVCGHTHKPYHRELPGGRHIINTGSVGKPKDGDPRAGYLNVTITPDTVSVDFIRVPYDVEKAASAIEASQLPHEFASMLREARG